MFPRNQDLHFMQIVSIDDDLYEMSNYVFWENKKLISNFHLQKTLPIVWNIEKINKILSIGTVFREK